MSNPSDDIDMQVLSELNSRTLVGGAAIEPGLISGSLGMSEGMLHDILAKLEQRQLVLRKGALVALTPAGHEHLSE